jgi:hypothetical protein
VTETEINGEKRKLTMGAEKQNKRKKKEIK